MRRALLVLVSMVPAAAEGQQLRDAATRGAEIPAGVMAGDADATGIVLSPGNLGFLPSWSVVAAGTWVRDDVARSPSGGGVYLAAPLPLLDFLAVGAAAEVMRPPGTFVQRSDPGHLYGDGGRLALALAVRVLPSLSLGVTWSHLFGGTLGDLDTADLSLAARLGRYVALTAVVRDVAAPLYQGQPTQRGYAAELALRPLGDSRLEIALFGRVGESALAVAPGLRLHAELTPGLALRGAVDYVRDLDGVSGPDHAVRGTVGLQLDFGRFGFGVYGLAGTRGDGTAGGQFQGLAATLRLSGDRYPSLRRARRLERVDLAGAATSPRLLPALLRHLDQLARDRRSDGVLAVMGELDGSWATMEEVRAAFGRLRAAGKHVVVYAAELSMKGYYAASAAEKVLLDPGGGVRFAGVHTHVLYFKGALDNLGVRADIVKIAEYKSTPEQFMRTGASDEAREVREALLDDLDGRILARVAEDRHLDAARLAAVRDAGPYTAQGALAAGLVDQLAGGDEVEPALARVLGHPVELSTPPRSPARPRSFAPRQVAVIHVDGDIVEGRSRTLPLSLPFLGGHLAGHETLLRAIERARTDDSVRAIVVRVDSPGGNAFASDLLARELLRTRAVKPVLCSFGDVAASGGYYLAAGCDTIFADPSTVTGSIGIFAGKADLSGLAAKLGVTVEVGKRGPHADQESWFRPYTDEERAATLARLRYYYDRFVGTVAAGRNLKPAEVEAKARGRVYTGAQAHAARLVERLGGFLDALDEAARRGDLAPGEDFELLTLPDEPTTLLGQLADLVGLRPSSLAATDLPAALRALLGAIPASLLLGPDAPQARMELRVE